MFQFSQEEETEHLQVVMERTPQTEQDANSQT